MRRLLVIAWLLFLIPLPNAFAGQTCDTVYVSVKKLPVHKSPDGYSPVVAILPFGYKVRALEYIDYRPLPKSTQPPAWTKRRERKLEKLKERDSPLDRAKIKKLEKELAEGKMLPVWIRTQKGYVHYQGTVPEHKWGDQFEDKAKERVKEWAITKGKRGFSENENSNEDLVAMRGLAGKAMAANPDYKALDAMLGKNQCYDFYNKYSKFREQGELGEYKKD